MKPSPGIRAIVCSVMTVRVLSARPTVAGPPFMTDDPVPVDYRHSEFYIFSTQDKARDGKNSAFPAFEFNYGVLPDTQLHIAVPFARSSPTDASSESGMGDVEIGVKYRFVQETGSSPQIGIFPMAELATGDSGKGLGNGRTWWRLPVWIQKGWGEWTTYGGAGYVVNRAAGQNNYPFAGWLLQKDIGEKWTLGGEVFARGRDTVDGQATTLLNVGGVAGLLLFSRPQTAPEHDPMPVPFSRRTGSLWLSLFFALLVGLPLWARLFPGPIVAMVDAFYRAGSLVFGGGHVVLPMLQAEVVPPGWIGNEAFLAGYGAAQAVPGPLFTFAAFLGASMNTGPSGWMGA
nr:chromate transporter [Thiobacillus sp. SCN 63-57]